MKTVEFLSYLRRLDIQVFVDGVSGAPPEALRLRCNVPKGTLTPFLRAELAERKAEIISFLRQAKVTDAASSIGLTPISRAEAAPPLSFAQQRLWFLNQLESSSGFYNIPAAVLLSGQLNVVALEHSFNEIISRHEALRTNFITVEGQPVQKIAPTLNLTLPVVDLRDVPEKEREILSKRLVTEEAERRFDLAQEPLVRATLQQLGEKEHILLLTMHHIVSDGWSIGVLVRELAELYKSFSNDLPSSLSELPIQYADFAAWQRQWLQGEVLEAQLSYWRKHLSSAPSVLELPTDHPRPAIQKFRGATYSLKLSQELYVALKTFSQQEGSTLFMTLLAAFKTLLYRYTGSEDIVVGTPIANRNRAEIEGLIGFFVNTLVLRTDLSGNPSFQDLLRRVREVALGAYAHQDLPFEQLVEELQPQRDLSHTPLFQVMFVLENTPMSALKLPGLTLSFLENNSDTAKFDLTLMMAEVDGELTASLEYNTDLFDGSTIERMTGHFMTLLSGIVANPHQRISQLPLLTESEQHQLLVEWNRTQTDYPQDLCIHQLFESQVERTPDAVAVVYENQQLTYHQLNSRANQLAHYLRSLGVGADVLVGICVERSQEMLVGLLGILKAGGAYVPIDPEYPQERKGFILADTQTPILLTQQHLATNLPTNDIKVICLDTDWKIIATQQIYNPVSKTIALNLAYVIYTSGSTGQPKGTLIPHQGLVNYLSWCTQAYGVEHGTGTLVHSPLGFDLTITSLFSPLLVGNQVEIISEDQGIETLSNSLRHHSNLSLVKITPAHLELLNQQLSPKEAASRTRAFIIGGENLLAENIAFWQEFAKETMLVNEYGPTETVVGCCIYKVPTGQSLSGSVPIGRPIANTQIYILDQFGQPVPIGVPGELHIGGAGLARGYLNRSELTQEKFIPNPFSNYPGSHLYKTGDLARYLSDGNIEYLGRIDNQVKVRGFRIELGEIEAVLSQHPDVLQAVVIIREDVPGDRRLVAYFVLRQEQALTVSDLRSFLKEQLPEYMVPNALVMLDSLPLTPNGKLDRRALPIPNQVGTQLQDTFVAPRDTLELQLVQIWEKVLVTKPVGVKDNFFDLGGHSLLAVSLMAQIQKQFGQSLPLTTLFGGATIEQMATILRQKPNFTSWSPLVEIQPVGSKRPFFCVHPSGGNVLCYVDLAHHLGLDQPFYGLQAQGLEGEQEPYTQIEKMASHYIEALRTVQPEGPYFLGGWSMGGIVAFEMAQQLQAQGRKVALLALIDAHFMTFGVESTDEDDVALLGSFAQDIGFSWENLEFSLDSFLQLQPEERLLYLLREVQIANLLSPNVKLPEFRRLFHVFKTNVRSMCNYKPRHLVGRVTLFKASEQFTEASLEPTLGWDKLVSEGVEIHMIPGNHYTIFRKPHVQVLAERLKTCLDLVQVLNSEE